MPSYEDALRLFREARLGPHPGDRPWLGRGRGRRQEFLERCRGRGIARRPKEGWDQDRPADPWVATEPSLSEPPSRGMCARPSSPLRGAWRARSARPATRIRPGPAAVDGADTAAFARPSLIIDTEGSVRWLQQAETELVGARRMVAENAAHRPLPSAAVWHCQQAVEMALKSAMLCTGGLTDEELAGRASHDLSGFRRSFERAQETTRGQRRFQQVPVAREDLKWLKRAYLAARYPNASTTGVPEAGYTDASAQHAIAIAEGVLHWAACLVDRGPAADVRHRPAGTAASSSGGV